MKSKIKKGFGFTLAVILLVALTSGCFKVADSALTGTVISDNGSSGSPSATPSPTPTASPTPSPTPTATPLIVVEEDVPKAPAAPDDDLDEVPGEEPPM